MSYVGKKVYVISELSFGEIVEEENDKVLVNVRSFSKRFQKWYPKDSVRLWSEDIEEACGSNRKCWTICGGKLE